MMDTLSAKPAETRSASMVDRLAGIAGRRSAILAVMGLGLALRLAHYFYNRAFWRDECSLWVSLAELPWSRLSGQLYYNNEAPLGFLYLQKAVLTLAGDSEFVLRAVPLLAGLSALPLFYLLARRMLSPGATLFAVALFAVGYSPVYFSAELKPYSVELAFAVALQLIAVRALDQDESRKSGILLGALGGLAIWFSFQAIFVLAGAGLAFLIRGWTRGERRWYWAGVLPGVAWVASLAGFFFVSLERILKNQEMQSSWDKHFWPVVPRSVQDLVWLPKHFFSLFRSPGDQTVLGCLLAAALVVVAVRALWRARDLRLAVLIVPMILPLFASAIRAYPYHGRHVLFALPALLVLTARGIEELAKALPTAGPRLASIVGAVIFGSAVFMLVNKLSERLLFEDMRPLLASLDGDVDDTIYVYHGAKKGFDYYGPKYKAEQRGRIVFGTHDPNEVRRLDGAGRVWVVVVRVPDETLDDWPVFAAQLNQFGACTTRKVVEGASRHMRDAVALYRCEL
jgi:hypothetical protein